MRIGDRDGLLGFHLGAPWALELRLACQTMSEKAVFTSSRIDELMFTVHRWRNYRRRLQRGA
jgi:hypothetical protein